MSREFAAVDLGATSGRVFLGGVDSGRLRIEPVTRFANSPLELPSGLHWNIGGLWAGMISGLSAAATRHPDVESIGIDTWGADYGLVRAGRLLGLPYHYRDPRPERAMAWVHRRVGERHLFGRNGLEPLPFNSVYQLSADRDEGVLELADHMLATPDLLGYWLTNCAATEPTIASTSGLLNVSTGAWDTELAETLELPASVLPRLVRSGDLLGPVRDDMTERLGFRSAVVVRKVASHDTASAVLSTPLAGPSAAYLSCGTWALIGVERNAPVLTDDARAGRFTNEIGAGGSVLFQKNLMGLGLLSGLLAEHPGTQLEQVLVAASGVDLKPEQLIDPGDAAFLRPGRTTAAICSWFAVRSIAPPVGLPALVRCVLESLARAFSAVIEEIEALTDVSIPAIHIVGGGSQNALLCQLTADRARRPVIAGPVEASVIGNVLIQYQAAVQGTLDIPRLREMVRNSFSLTTYRPRSAP